MLTYFLMPVLPAHPSRQERQDREKSISILASFGVLAVQNPEERNKTTADGFVKDVVGEAARVVSPQVSRLNRPS
jgi:hypothetical protein